MPWPTDTFAALEAGDIFTDRNYVPNNLVPWDPRERVAQKTLPEKILTVTHAAGQNLYEDLALAGLLEFDIFEGQVAALFLKNGGLVCLRERW